MTKQEKEKLNELRDWLISETEWYQNRAKCSSGSSPYGSHYFRGTANGYIQSRGKLEQLFGLI